MPVKSDSLLVGLSMGTTRTTMIVAKKDKRYPDSIQVVGFGTSPSRGLSKGVIIDSSNAARSIKRAFEDAQSITGIPADRLKNVVVAFNAMEVQSESSHGMVTLGDRESKAVETKDIDRVIDRAKDDLASRNNMYAIHRIPMSYELDGVPVSDPLNMNGNRLDIWLQTVSLPVTYVQTVRNCVRAAGLEVSGLVLKPLVSSLGAVYEDEMQAGCVSVCIGGGTTGIVLYRGGRAFRVASIPIGGDHIKSDLAAVLNISFGEAEHLKKRIFTSNEDDLRREGIDVDLAMRTIVARVDELFNEYVRDVLSECTPQHFPGGVILSGGVSDTPGIDFMLSDILNMPVRKVEEPIYVMPPDLANASYVSAAGILRYRIMTERDPYMFMSDEQTVSAVSERSDTRERPAKKERDKSRQYEEEYDDSSDELEEYAEDEYEEEEASRENFGDFMRRMTDRFKKLF